MAEHGAATLERALAVALASVAALIAVTCSGRGALERAPVAPKTATVPPKPAGASGPSLEPTAAPGASVSALGAGGALGSSALPTDPTRLELRHFFADLTALEKTQRTGPVRIVWLGDSHTAADYLTGAVRSRLQSRFGAGGPGFVRVGVKPYRHSQVHWACDGAWKLEPSAPSRRTLFDDGVFGLGGLRAFPDSAPAQASFELSPSAASGRLNWQIWVSVPEGASFRVTLAGVSQVVTRETRASELPGAGFVSLPLESAVSDKLEILTLNGAPKFYGVLAEGTVPGLVLDAVGIDGARLSTMLAWNEGSFEAALRARAPSLVALAFGTNEAFDADKVEKYRAQYQSVWARLRAGAPDADCLIVGPTDGNAVSGGSEPRIAEIDALQRSVAGELGCGYVSQFELMGGAGGYTRWARETPQLARGDRLHLTPKGYETIANKIADRLLEAYTRAPR